MLSTLISQYLNLPFKKNGLFSISFLVTLFKKVYLFILRRGGVCGQERGGEREGEIIPSRLYAVSLEPDMGLEPNEPNCEIMT